MIFQQHFYDYHVLLNILLSYQSHVYFKKIILFFDLLFQFLNFLYIKLYLQHIYCKINNFLFLFQYIHIKILIFPLNYNFYDY